MSTAEENLRRATDLTKSTGEEREAEQVLQVIGVPVTNGNVEQMAVMLEAYHKYLERNAVYENLWQDYGWMDTLTHVRSKAMRIVRKFWRDETAPKATAALHLDDALDLVNYVVFFIRNVREGNRWGRR